MPTPPPELDPVDVAASYPAPPAPANATSRPADPGGVPASPAATALDPALAARLDGVDSGTAQVVLSAEQLTATKEWTQTGAVRFRRRIATYTRTVEVTVRREELEVEVRDVTDRDGAWVGTEYRGPAVAAPPEVTAPGVFILRHEVPQVTVRTVPYERVVVAIDRITEQVRLTDTARREQAMVSGDISTAGPPPKE